MQKLSNYFNNNNPEESSDKLVGKLRKSANKNDSNADQMINFMAKASSKQSSDNIVESKMHQVKIKRFGDNSLKREENKNSSIPRRNLFKKKFTDITDASEDSEQKPQVKQSKLKNSGYKSLLEKRESSRELYKRYHNKSSNYEILSKLKTKSIDEQPKMSNLIISKSVKINGGNNHDSSDEFEELKESVSPLRSPNNSNGNVKFDFKDPSGKKRVNSNDRRNIYKSKVGGTSLEAVSSTQMKGLARERRFSCENDGTSDNENKSENYLKHKHEIIERLKETTSIKSEKRFLDEYDCLGNIENPDGGDTYTSKMRYLFESKGLAKDDPRIKDIISSIEELENKGEDITFEKFKQLVKPCYTFFRMLLQNQLTIKDYDSYHEKTNELFNKIKNENMGGFLPANSPQLSKVDSDGFAVSICTVDGQVLNFGDVDNFVCMHQITSVVSYLNALQEHGQDVVSSYIGTEPSGQSFDSLELLKKVPHNPLISSGILTCCSLLYQEDTIDRRYERDMQSKYKGLLEERK